MQVNRIENTGDNSSTSRTPGGYVTSKANWEVFIEVLKKEWNEVPKNMPGSKMQCIERVKDLTRAMRKACNTAIPSRNRTARKVPWWDSRLKAAKKES